MTNAYYNKTIALAGVQQSLYDIQQIAWSGQCNFDELDTCLSSLFVRNPNNYDEVFGEVQNLRSGLNALKVSFTQKRDKEALERTRYMVSLMMLAKKIRTSESLSQQIGTTLSLLEEAAQDIENQRDYIIQRLAQLYQNAISVLTPRIIIYGKPKLLDDQNNAAMIRALLLAGLRSVILWYQAGGSQTSLLLGKNKYLQSIEQLLDS